MRWQTLGLLGLVSIAALPLQARDNERERHERGDRSEQRESRTERADNRFERAERNERERPDSRNHERFGGQLPGSDRNYGERGNPAEGFSHGSRIAAPPAMPASDGGRHGDDRGRNGPERGYADNDRQRDDRGRNAGFNGPPMPDRQPQRSRYGNNEQPSYRGQPDRQGEQNYRNGPQHGYGGQGYDRYDQRDRRYGGYADRRGLPEPWDRRNRDWRRHWQHGWSGHRYHAPARYYYPSGYSYRSWRIGHYLPWVFIAPSYYIDYRPFGIAAPPYGCRWIRVDGDLLLVELVSGEIVDLLYRFFY